MTLKALYHTFGCKLNFAETATIEEQLAANGIVSAAKNDTPDIIVVNTCSVTATADKKCNRFLRSMHIRYPEARIIVTGCYARLNHEEVSQLPRVEVCDNPKSVVAMLCADTSVPDSSFSRACGRGDRTRYFLKVQDGCDYWCTYCTIPKARGRSRSGEIDDLIKQAKAVAVQGGKEIVITGVNIGDFGKGRTDTFFDLIRELDKVEGILRYRISSIEPNLITDEIIDWVAQSRAFMPHFHIPLQAGSDDVLRLMHRRYDTALFADKIRHIREAIPHAFIGVDLIVGMRGETEELFNASQRFVSSLDITQLHIFPYSERPGTRALAIEPAVSQAEKHRRVKVMEEVSNNAWHTFASRFIGTTRPVLLEGSTSGFTDNYLRVAINNTGTQSARLQANTIVNVQITGINAPDKTVTASLPTSQPQPIRYEE